MKWKQLSEPLLVTFLIAFIFITILLVADNSILISEIENLEDDVYDAEVAIIKQYQQLSMLQDELTYTQEQLYYWMYAYEPETIWNNETIYEHIYHNNTNYIYENYTIFDVNRDGTINYYDAFEIHNYITTSLSIMETITFNTHGNPYELLYDVNIDGSVNYNDVNLIWEFCD